MPRWMILVLGAALVLAYVPLTGLDHLHLHLEHGLRFAHDHLHVGHHEHSHAEPADPAPDGRGEHRDGDDDSAGSAVVSFGNASQVRPLGIDLERQDSRLPNQGLRDVAIGTGAALRPSWQPRAPPV